MTDPRVATATPSPLCVVYRALETMFQGTIGAKLFTITEIDRARGVARRRFSNTPDAYPESGEKTIEPNAWTEQVEGRQEVFVANSIDEIAAVFSDHELIQSLGCESCLNLPIVIAGQVVGTINCLDEAGHYTAERVAAAMELRQAGALAFMVAATYGTGA